LRPLGLITIKGTHHAIEVVDLFGLSVLVVLGLSGGRVPRAIGLVDVAGDVQRVLLNVGELHLKENMETSFKLISKQKLKDESMMDKRLSSG
jgi:hypothetical protein